jgi:hypothetical protein
VSEVATLLAAMLSPLLALGLLLWLTHLEETLPRDVHDAARRPDPPPVLTVPLRHGDQVALPEQREPAQAFSRSTTLSLGGSTNR